MYNINNVKVPSGTVGHQLLKCIATEGCSDE